MIFDKQYSFNNLCLIYYSDSKEFDPYLWVVSQYKLQLSKEPLPLSVAILSSYQRLNLASIRNSGLLVHL